MTRSTLTPKPPTLLPQVQRRLRPRPMAVRGAADGQLHALQQFTRQALAVVRQGALDAAVTTGVVGGLASLGLPYLGTRVQSWVGLATATCATVTVAQALHAAFAPDWYLGAAEHLRRADRAWERGSKALALHHVEFAEVVGPQRAMGPHPVMNDRHLAEMVTYAAERQSWSALRLLTGCLPSGSRGYWEAMLAAHRAGKADQVPLQPWAEEILRMDPPPLSPDEAVLLTDILVEGPRVCTPRRSWERSLGPGLMACAWSAQNGGLDEITRHRLVRLFMQTPQLCTSAMHDLARAPSALRQALFAIDALDRAGKLPERQRAAAYELLNGVALAAPEHHAEFFTQVQAFVAGRLSFGAFTLAVAEQHGGSPAAHAALARHMLAQFLSGDTPSALATARRIDDRYDRDNARHKAMQTALAGAPDAFEALFLAAVRAHDEAAVQRLLPLASQVAPARRLRLFDALSNACWVDRRILFFRDGQLCLRDLSLPRLRAMVPTLARQPGLDRDDDAGLRDLLCACGGDLPDAVLRVWLAAARTPELVGVFKRLAYWARAGTLQETAIPALAEGRLSDQGFLLAMHLVDAAPGLDLAHPRAAALLHCQAVLKHAQRARRLLSGLAQLAKLSVYELGDQAEKILTWPDDAAMRPWLQAACVAARGQQLAALEALQAGTGDQAAARAASDKAEMWTENVHQHGIHAHAQGDRAVAQAYRDALRADASAQRDHVRRLSALLAPQSGGRALAQAFLQAAEGPAQEAAAKALNAWRKGCSKAPDAELAAQIHTGARLCAQRARTLRQLRKPVPAPSAAPVDYFAAHPHSKAAQALHHQHLVPLQVEALHALVSIEAFGGNVACATPLTALAEKRRVLQVSDAAQPAFDAMLGRFRDPQLFWSFASRMRRYDARHREGFDTTLRHLLAGTHTEQRRASPQMLAVFADSRHASARGPLRDAWEQGAWSVVPAGQAYAGLRLHDTGAFEDFASSGDEITGSCHSLMHGGFYAYLMGRVVCGSKRMLTIKDATGRMVARAVFRLMLDEHHQPTLLMSRTYAIGRERAHAEAVLRDFAVQRAAALGLPLLHGACTPRGATCVRVHCKTGSFAEYWDDQHADSDIVAPLLWQPPAASAA